MDLRLDLHVELLWLSVDRRLVAGVRRTSLDSRLDLHGSRAVADEAASVDLRLDLHVELLWLSVDRRLVAGVRRTSLDSRLDLHAITSSRARSGQLGPSSLPS